MMGDELSTRLMAVSPTARVAAFLLLPSDLSSSSPFSTFCFSSSVRTGKTSMPCRISSPRMRNTLSIPALATAAKGTKRPATIFALGERLLSRGTSALRPSATPHDAVTAVKYDLTIVDVGSGIDLFAFEKLIPTLSDWFVICHPSVPAVCCALACYPVAGDDLNMRTPRPGVSMPAVTTKLERTKQDMRKGRKTGCPVSCRYQRIVSNLLYDSAVPGCSVESIVFFASHSSGDMSRIFPVLYAVTSCFAFSRPAADVNSVLESALLAIDSCPSNSLAAIGCGTHHSQLQGIGLCACAAVSPRV